MRLSIILAVTLWASTFVGIRAAVIDFTPLDIAVLRFVVSSIILFVISIFQKVTAPDIKSFFLFILLGIILVVNYTALNYGTKSITAGETTLLVSTSQLFQVLLAYIFLKEAISHRFLVGLSICFFGIVVISFQNSKEISISWGVIFVLIAAITNAVFFVLQKPLLKKYTPLEVVSYSTWIASIFLLPGGQHVLNSFKTSGLNSTIGIVYIGAASVVANLCWSRILSNIDASKTAIYLYMVPVITIIIGFIWLRESPSFISCIGGALIIGGVLVSNSGSVFIPPGRRRRKNASA